MRIGIFIFFVGMISFVNHAAAMNADYELEILHADQSLIEDKKLLSGSHWLKNTDHYRLETPYGTIHSKNGDFFVRYENQRVTVVNHLGELSIHLKDGNKLHVPPGFEIWISEIKADRKNRVGFVAPVDLKEHVPVLAKMWNQDPKLLKNELLRFQSRWGDRAAIAAMYYKGLAQRKIASFQKEEDRIQSIKRQQKAQREANRQLLFERVFGR